MKELKRILNCVKSGQAAEKKTNRRASQVKFRYHGIVVDRRKTDDMSPAEVVTEETEHIRSSSLRPSGYKCMTPPPFPKVEPGSPGGDKGSANTPAFNVGSSSFTLSASDVSGSRRGLKFESNKFFNCSSEYSEKSIDHDQISKYCSFYDSFAVFSPSVTDRMWTPFHPSRHVIPDIYFEDGFGLPMHPFYLFVFEALECGLSQLVPNVVLQINGLIARCHEHGWFPTIDLLFSIFRVKSTGTQLYLDKKRFVVNLLKSPAQTLSGLVNGLVLGSDLFRLSRRFLTKPTEEFLARLVKSKAASASIMAVYGSDEKGPGVDSRVVTTAPGTVKTTLVGADVTMKDKDKEKKRHSDSHSSRNHHSKRFKECAKCPIFDEVQFMIPVGESRVRPAVVSDGSIRPLDKSFFCLQLSAKLERVVKLSDVPDPDELEVEGLNAALGASMDNLVENEAFWIDDKAELITKLDGMGVSLSCCQTEALKSFEEGYGEFLNRLAGSGVDVKDHGFDSYLADVENKVQVRKVTSSAHSGAI
ncbi:hypothetical protein AgCh_013286 [Apium graveolens]